MRALLLASVLGLSPLAVAGDPGPCLERGIVLFPAPGSVVPTDVRFLLEGIGPEQGEEAWIGHDACSGSFTFDDGRAYRATVEGFDCAGNPAPRLKPIEFHAPRQNAR